MHRMTTATLALVAPLALGAAANAATWDGSESGDWQVGDNWVSGSVPSAGNPLEFGVAGNYAVTNSPSTLYGTLTFQNTAGANYSLSGNGTNNEKYGTVTVQGSASATNHTINNQFRFNNKTINVESLLTSITFTAFDYGGSGRTLTKNGDGTLILTQNANNPGSLQINGGTVDYQNGVGTSNGAYEINGASSTAVVTNTTGSTQTLQLGYGETGSASFAGVDHRQPQCHQRPNQ